MVEVRTTAYRDLINDVKEILPDALYGLGEYVQSTVFHEYIRTLAKDLVKAEKGIDCKDVYLVLDVDDIAEAMETHLYELSDDEEKELEPALTLQSGSIILKIYCADPSRHYRIKKEWDANFYLDEKT